MATFFERNLKQTATYWAPMGTDMFGKPIWDAPVEVACRWEDKVEQITNKEGQEIVSKSRVFFARDIDIDGYLLLGTSAESDPTTLQLAYEIQLVTRTPDLKNLKTLFVAFL